MGCREGLVSLLPVVDQHDIKPGTEISGFDFRTPCSDVTCRDQINQNLSRGFPDLFSPRRRISIIANGPSARHADLSGYTACVNGSLKLFLDRGLRPTYWIACDPQAVVADFLPENPPEDTVYLLASKCHPSIFEKLKNNIVYVWHLSDVYVPGKINIPPTCSVTVCAAWVLARLGYTDFDFYGWDGCYQDGLHHASEDTTRDPELYLNYGGTIDGDDVRGGRTFPTSVSWAAEAKGAEQFFQLAKYFDLSVTVHGDGMFAYAKKFLEV